MSNARLYQVLKTPVFSEKSQRLGDSLNVQVFKWTVVQPSVKSNKLLS